MNMLLTVVVLLSAAVLSHAAPVEDASTETIPLSNLEVIVTDLKNTKNIDSQESASTIADDDQQELNPDKSPIIKDILDKLDKADISTVIDEEKALKTKSSAMESVMTTEIKKSDDTTLDTTKQSTENKAEDGNNKLPSTTIKASDSTDYIKKITEETVSNNDLKTLLVYSNITLILQSQFVFTNKLSNVLP